MATLATADCIERTRSAQECPNCGQLTLCAYRRTQSRGQQFTYLRCPCGQHLKETKCMDDVASEHFRRRSESPYKVLPPLDPSIRCDNCSTRGSLRVKRDLLDEKAWLRRLSCVCLACSYEQTCFEPAPPKPSRQRAS